MITPEGFISEYRQEFAEYILGITYKEHNPATCSTPGHVVIKLPEGDLVCGPGGYNPRTNVGTVFLAKGPNAPFIQGEFIKSTPGG